MKLFKVVSVCLCLCVAPLAMAEKIAVLGIQEALLSSKAAVSFRESLTKELKKDETSLLELEKQAKGIREKLQKNGSTMSEDEVKRTRLQFQKAFEEYQRTGQALQQKRAEREQEFLAKMKPQLDEVIRSVIKADGYDIVIAKQATVYANKAMDITPKVIELLNKK